MTLAVANAIYANLDFGRVLVERVASDRVQEFSTGVTALARLVPDDDQDDHLVVSWLKRLRFTLSSVPVSYKHPFGHCLEKPPLERWRKQLCAGYPAEHVLIDGVFDAVDRFVQDSSAPLWTLFEELLTRRQDGERIAAIPPDTSLLSCFEQAAIDAASAVGLDLTVMGQRGLAGDQTFDAIFLFGTPAWFKWSTFATPRAPVIHMLQYAWIASPLPSGPSFPDSSLRARPSRRRIEVVGATPHHEVLAADDLAPHLVEPDGDQDEAAKPGQTGLMEDARLVSLEAGHAVYISTNEDDRVIVIDASEGYAKVVRIAAAELEPGMHLVLMTEGAADYVREVADARLGKKAKELRSIESRWKTRLVQFTNELGEEDQAASVLRHAGLSYASRGAVRRWCSSRNIGTKTPAAFKVLMDSIGLGTETKMYWANAEELWKAHRAAGVVIRSMLLEVLRHSDLKALQRYGRMDFELDTPGAGTLTAFTVREISTRVRPVLAGKIERPFRTSGQLSWLD